MIAMSGVFISKQGYILTVGHGLPPGEFKDISGKPYRELPQVAPGVSFAGRLTTTRGSTSEPVMLVDSGSVVWKRQVNQINWQDPEAIRNEDYMILKTDPQYVTECLDAETSDVKMDHDLLATTAAGVTQKEAFLSFGRRTQASSLIHSDFANSIFQKAGVIVADMASKGGVGRSRHQHLWKSYRDRDRKPLFNRRLRSEAFARLEHQKNQSIDPKKAPRIGQ